MVFKHNILAAVLLYGHEHLKAAGFYVEGPFQKKMHFNFQFIWLCLFVCLLLLFHKQKMWKDIHFIFPTDATGDYSSIFFPSIMLRLERMEQDSWEQKGASVFNFIFEGGVI